MTGNPSKPGLLEYTLTMVYADSIRAKRAAIDAIELGTLWCTTVVRIARREAFGLPSLSTSAAVAVIPVVLLPVDSEVEVILGGMEARAMFRRRSGQLRVVVSKCGVAKKIYPHNSVSEGFWAQQICSGAADTYE